MQPLNKYMKKYNVECSEDVTFFYTVEVEAENEQEARDIVYNDFWDLKYYENDSRTDGIEIDNINEIIDEKDDDL